MPTDNHEYNVPEQGSSDWHIPLNANFEALDADVEIRDTEQNIINGHSPHEGAKALATDTGRIYLGNGTEWVHTGTVPEVDIYVQSDEPANPSENDIWIEP